MPYAITSDIQRKTKLRKEGRARKSAESSVAKATHKCEEAATKALPSVRLSLSDSG